MSHVAITGVIFQNGDKSLLKLLSKAKLGLPLIYTVVAFLEKSAYVKTMPKKN